MKKKTKTKKVIVSVLILILVVFLGLFLWHENEKQQEQITKYNELDSQIRPLNVKKNQLTNEIEQLQEEYESARKPKATTQIIFTNLDRKVYEVCYPLLKARGFTGVLALSKTEFPGVKGCMTLEQFNELRNAGWTACVTWTEEEAFDQWWPALQYGMKQIGLEVPKTIYCPKGTYKATLDEQFRAANFDIVVHHEEVGRTLIQTQYEEELWHLGAIGLMGSGTKTRFEDAIKAKGNIIYLVGFDLPDEKYDQKSFIVMLDYFVSYTEDADLIVGNMEDARNHYHSRKETVSEEEKRVYLEQRAVLEKQLADIEAQLAELQSK